jgi:polyhydroxyalkanoate synthesis regulator phasin
MDITWLINNQKKFEQMSSDEKRKFLGNLMYYRVASQQNVSKELVPKITGMLIDLEVLELSDIIEILKNDDALKERIADAINIINDNDQ